MRVCDGPRTAGVGRVRAVAKHCRAPKDRKREERQREGCCGLCVGLLQRGGWRAHVCMCLRMCVHLRCLGLLCLCVHCE